MGCDIHEWVEKRKAGRWQMTGLDLRIPRNYNLFGMLADVRNGIGFAGVDMGDGFVPVLGRENPKRGVPEDASPEYLAEVESWDSDGHSHSWLTLAELKAYDWTGQKTKQRGIVSAQERVRWRESGDDRPGTYCGGVSGSSVKIVTLAELDAIIASGKQTVWSYYARCEWETTYAEAAGSFLTDSIPALEVYAKDHGLAHEDVRLVFFFDN